MSIHQPPLEDLEAWRTFWQAQGQPWRREPEISVERQKFLASRRAIPVDVAHGVYPFKGNDIKLTRADVEWLLDTHESEGVRGPVDWNDVSSRYREGLDLRGADLRSIDLSDLPLARLRAGFDAAGVTLHYWRNATVEQREAAAVHLEGAKLCRAQLQEATLWRSHLNGANLEDARLEGANLSRTHF